jgi:hypothetical protein
MIEKIRSALSRKRDRKRMAFFGRLESAVQMGQDSGESPEIRDVGDLIRLLIEDARWNRAHEDIDDLIDVAKLWNPQDNIHLEMRRYPMGEVYEEGGVPITITINPAEVWWTADGDYDAFLKEFADTCQHEVLHVLFTKEGIEKGHHIALDNLRELELCRELGCWCVDKGIRQPLNSPADIGGP